MPDTVEQAGDTSVATPPTIRWDVFDGAAEKKGATTETAKAELVGVSRETLWRWREGVMRPGLATALRIADNLQVDIRDLIDTGRVA